MVTRSAKAAFQGDCEPDVTLFEFQFQIQVLFSQSLHLLQHSMNISILNSKFVQSARTCLCSSSSVYDKMLFPIDLYRFFCNNIVYPLLIK